MRLVVLYTLIYYLLYVFYLDYRIIRKFDPTVSIFKSLIPFYCMFRLVKIINPKKVHSVIIGIIFQFQFNLPTYGETGQWISLLINCYIGAWIYGNIARRLGKNFMLHSILAFLQIPLLITMPLLALDKSRPVELEKTNDIPLID